MEEFEFIDSVKLGSLDLFNQYFKDEYLNIEWGVVKWRPIHLACEIGHSKIVKLLINKSCDIEACDKYNRRPIHLACIKGHTEIVKLLMQANCDSKALTQLGDSPLKLAEINNNNEIIDILNEKETVIQVAKICETDQINRMIERMRLKCEIPCDHELCPKSLREKTFHKGSKIGSGAFGEVFKCKGSITKTEFALKMIKLKCIDKMYFEENNYEFRSDLSHNRIVQIFGSIQKEKHLCIFMEFLPGESLQSQIKKEKTIANDNVIHYSKQILEGLIFLHGKKFIHRDLKPANILKDLNNNIKLGDSGLSRFLMTADGKSTDAHSFVGSNNFMAPEILQGESYNVKADIWSLGVTVINMITGKPPFNKNEIVLALISNESLRNIPLPELQVMPDQMKTFILAMLTPEPQTRPGASDLLAFELFSQ